VPSWKIHEKWALRLGIPIKVVKYVNKFIDNPQSFPDFLIFCSKKAEEWRIKSKSRKAVLTQVLATTVAKHDAGRHRRTAAYLQLEFLSRMDTSYVKAWYLHHALDYLEGTPSLSPSDALKRFKERAVTKFDEEFDFTKELEQVLAFLGMKLQGVLQDLRYY
jgi:hypothetical protein